MPLSDDEAMNGSAVGVTQSLLHNQCVTGKAELQCRG